MSELCWDEHRLNLKSHKLISNSCYQTMNFLSLIQRQQQKKQALQAAQNAIAKTVNLTYRGVCYTR